MYDIKRVIYAEVDRVFTKVCSLTLLNGYKRGESELMTGSYTQRWHRENFDQYT